MLLYGFTTSHLFFPLKRSKAQEEFQEEIKNFYNKLEGLELKKCPIVWLVLSNQKYCCSIDYFNRRLLTVFDSPKN